MSSSNLIENFPSTYYNDDDFDSSDDDFLTTLPFPKPLNRDSFSAEDFEIDEFLCSSYQYKTLDDLKGELSTLQKKIKQELVDLVNNDYIDFINLGKSLEGGGAKVDDIKMNVFRYQKELKSVQLDLNKSAETINELLQERKEISELKQTVRSMIVISQQLDLLDRTIFSLSKETPSLEDFKFLISNLVLVIQRITKYPIKTFSKHPFIESQSIRAIEIKTEVKGLLDSALRVTLNKSKINSSDKGLDLLSLLSIYKILGYEKDALAIIKGKSRR